MKHNIARANDCNTYMVQVAGLEQPLTVQYQGGKLASISGLEELSAIKGDTSELRVERLPIPWAEADISKIRLKFGDKVSYTLEGKHAQEKIVLWCQLYKDAYNIAYKVSAAEVMKLKKVHVSKDLLRAYFEQPDKYPFLPKSIENYVRTLNELLRLVAGKVSAEAKLPNHWNNDYYHTLSADAAIKYLQHLTALGFTKVITNTGFYYTQPITT